MQIDPNFLIALLIPENELDENIKKFEKDYFIVNEDDELVLKKNDLEDYDDIFLKMFVSFFQAKNFLEHNKKTKEIN